MIFVPEHQHAPDLTRPVLGFRAWEMTYNGPLRSFGNDGSWAVGINEAHCRVCSEPSHKPPEAQCGCGLYAFHSIVDLVDYGLFAAGLYIVGAVAAWGEMQIHTTGFRARYARILALGWNPPQPAASEAAARYRVPLVPLHQLETVGRRFADPVPPALLPLPDLSILVIDCGPAASRDDVWAQLQQGCEELGPQLTALGEVSLIACGSEVQQRFIDDGGEFQRRLRHLTCGESSVGIAAGIRYARRLVEIEPATYGTIRLIAVAAELPDDRGALAGELAAARRQHIETYIAAPLSLDDLLPWLEATRPADWLGGADVAELADEVASLPDHFLNPEAAAGERPEAPV